MRNTERRAWSFGDIGIRVAILTLAALLLMALQITDRLKPVQSAITQFTSPAQTSSSGVATSVGDTISFLTELRTLRQRAAELEQLNGNLLVENFRLREVERENQELRTMLAFAETRPGLELRGAQMVARVIGQESNNFLDYIMLDLGSVHGIEVGMPVVTDQGLVGRISEVTNTTSKVLLTTDTSSAVNAILQSSRVNGVVRGTPGGDLIMDYIPQGVIFSVGEVVLTSGLGGNFPKGIPLGQVTEIIQRDIDVFQQAIVRPTVDFTSLELVMIVTNFNPLENIPDLLEPATEERGADESVPASDAAPANDTGEETLPLNSAEATPDVETPDVQPLNGQ